MRKVVFLALLAAMLPAITASAETMAEQQMAQKIGNQLKQSGMLHDYKIQIKFHDGTAFLDGTVTSVDQRTAAVRLAQRVKGVAKVQYKLEIPSKQEETSESQPAGENERSQVANALDRTAPDDRESSHVMQAYDQASEPATMPIQQAPMMLRNNPRMNGMAMQRNNMPLPARQMPGMMPIRQASATGVYQAGGSCAGCNGGPGMGMGGPGMAPAPSGFVPQGSGGGPNYDNPSMPGYAWPSYASYPNYAALTYPKQYSPTAWPYIGPFYPYPQVPLAWRKVSLEWDDGWWFLDFSSHNSSH